ncbi:MAG: P-II family nitrogen regulator [Nitrososphaeraceae archaeon]
MKRIEIIIPHHGLSQAVGALQSLGLHFTHYETKGRGKAPTLTVEFDRGTGTMMEEYNTNVTIMTVVADSMLDIAIERILNNIEDNEGKIFLYEVNEVIDIKSKRRGESAL